MFRFSCSNGERGGRQVVLRNEAIARGISRPFCDTNPISVCDGIRLPNEPNSLAKEERILRNEPNRCRELGPFAKRTNFGTGVFLRNEPDFGW